MPNDTLRSVREQEFQMSRSEFAAEINRRARAMGENGTGCTPRLVAAWERGEVRRPRPLYCRILTRMTGRTMEGLGFVPHRSVGSSVALLPSGAQPPEQDGGAEVERRTLLAEGAASALVFAFPAPERTGRRVGMAEVREVRRLVEALYAHDKDHGSAALRQGATVALHAAYSWLQSGMYREQTGRRLRSAVGSLCIAAGWLAYDSGRPSDTRSLYGEALAAARIADDAGLESHVFGCLSLLAKSNGRPREAIAAAQGALSVGRSLGSPRLLALFHMREAAGWALLGDESACEQVIVRANAIYAKGPRDADPDWLSFFTPAELVGLEALCRADLNQHHKAAHGAEQAVLLFADRYARNRALYTADIAVQHAVSPRPDPEAAVDAARRTLSFLPEVRSDRLVRALDDVAGALQRHARLPAVSGWFEEYQALKHTAGTGGRP